MMINNSIFTRLNEHEKHIQIMVMRYLLTKKDSYNKLPLS